MSEIISKIALDIIDDPHAPMRTHMDEEKLDELAASIRAHGLIQPITLRKVGERYEVVAGHRRTKAAKIAGLVFIDAIVRELDDDAMDWTRVHENLYREDVNVVDEARYIRKMVDQRGVEPKELARMTGKSVQYLKARYDLLDYPDYLLQAVEHGTISLTSARWLEKITDDRIRKEYTRFGILGGLTAKRAEAWYNSWTVGSLPEDASTFVETPVVPNEPPKKLIMPCLLCRYDDDIENMSMHYVHRDCASAVIKMQNPTASVSFQA